MPLNALKYFCHSFIVHVHSPSVTGLAGKISKEQTEPGAVAPELPLRAL